MQSYCSCRDVRSFRVTCEVNSATHLYLLCIYFPFKQCEVFFLALFPPTQRMHTDSGDGESEQTMSCFYYILLNLCLKQSVITIPNGGMSSSITRTGLDPRHRHRTPLHSLSSARLSSPQVCLRLFLNSCYSGATVCALNTKHSNPLSLIPSLTVGNCSHHWLTSIRRTVHTSVKCQPKSPSLILLLLLPLLLPRSLSLSPRTLFYQLSFPSSTVSLSLSLSPPFIIPLIFSLCLY